MKVSKFTWTKEYMIEVLTGGLNPLITDPQIINAIIRIERKAFLPESLKSMAYDDVNINLGNGSIMLRPTLMAKMLSFLKPKFGGNYLEIGSNSGYQSTILGFISGENGKVFSIEPNKLIYENARNNSQRYGLNNIFFINKKFNDGYSQNAPFDGIIVNIIDNDLIDILRLQLKVGSSLVSVTNDYNIVVVTRLGDDDFEEEYVSVDL